MNRSEQGDAEGGGRSLPRSAAAFVLAAAALPAVAVWAGWLRMPSVERAVAVFTMVEWTAVVMAALAFVLSLMHYDARGDVTTPIIGMAMLGAGVLDLCAVLGVNRMLVPGHEGAAPASVAWSLSRAYCGAVLLLGGAVFLISGRALPAEARRRDGRTMGLVAAACAVAAAAAVGFLWRQATDAAAGGDGIAVRWLDTAALAFFVTAGALVFPLFYRWHPDVFSHALLVSMLPQVAAQIPPSLGYRALDDPWFVAACMMKVAAYGIPVIGLLFDYRHAYRSQVRAQEELRREMLVKGQASAALDMDHELFSTLLRHMASAVFVEDASMRFARMNAGMARVLGLQGAADALGRPVREFVALQDAGDFADEGARILKTGESPPCRRVRFKGGGADGGREMMVRRIPIRDRAGRTVSILGLEDGHGRGG